jgi:hypothetical protein
MTIGAAAMAREYTRRRPDGHTATPDRGMDWAHDPSATFMVGRLLVQGVPPTEIKPEPGRDHVMTEAADFADFVQRRSGALLRAAWLLTSAELPESAAATGGFQQVDVRESLRRALRELTARQRAVIMLRSKALARLRLVPGLADILTEGTAA